MTFLEAAGRTASLFHEVPSRSGVRRYFRGSSGPNGPEILQLYAEKEEGVFDRWVSAQKLLSTLLRVPAVHLSDRSVPAIIVEDFGPVNLAERAKRESRRAEDFYQAAADAAAGLRRLSPAVVGDLNPALDAALFRHELHLTRTEFFVGLLGQKWDSRRRAFFDEWVFRLGERLDAMPRTSCHRDFHGTNLFLLTDGTVGLIDFQDLRPGPLGYDIAALLFEQDAVELLDEEAIDDILRAYARSLGLGVSDLMKAVALCRLQRGWRAVGTLAREVRRSGEKQAELERQLGSLRSLLDDMGDGGTAMPEFMAAETRVGAASHRSSPARSTEAGTIKKPRAGAPKKPSPPRSGGRA